MDDSFPRFEYWETNGKWYWHLVAGNGFVIADGSEGYDNESNVRRAITNLIEVANEARDSETQVEMPE